jgi:hypothetical protein
MTMWQSNAHLFLISAILVSACGGAALPSQRLTDARAAIRGAEEVGAEKNPQAALHLKLARDQVARAEKLIEEDENEKAELALRQAQADADLALALTHEAEQQRQAEAARARISELRSQAQSHETL